MRVLFRLFAIVIGVLAGRLGRRLFKDLWSRIDEGDPPAVTSLDASLPKVLAAVTLEATMIAGMVAIAERLAARAFQHLFGVSVAPKKKQS